MEVDPEDRSTPTVLGKEHGRSRGAILELKADLAALEAGKDRRQSSNVLVKVLHEIHEIRAGRIPPGTPEWKLNLARRYDKDRCARAWRRD